MNGSNWILLGSLYTACAWSASAVDVRFYCFAKGQNYTQEGPSPPVLAPAFPFEYRAFAVLNGPIRQASAKWPNGTVRSLTNFVTLWERRETFSAKSGLDFAAPNGIYAMIVQTFLDGNRTNNLTISADFYPGAPSILNFAAAQAVNRRNDFLLRWNPVSAMDGNDFFHLVIYDGESVVFQTGEHPGAANVIPGTATSVTVPQGRLHPGKVYKAVLTAWNRVAENTTSYPGALGWAAYFSKTEFPMRAAWDSTDLQWFGISKTARFEQTSAAPPGPAPQNPFYFTAFLEATDAPNVISASIRSPNALTQVISPTGLSWAWRESFASESALDAVYGRGDYELTAQTRNNGLQRHTLKLTAASYPAAPQISNWNEANRIDSSRSFALTWNLLPGGTANSFVQVRVFREGQTIFQTANYLGAPGALNGTATSVTLPAGLFQPGEACECSILYFQPAYTEPFSYPGVLGVAGLARETSALLRARGGNLPRPALHRPKRSGGIFEFEIEAAPGRLYGIESSLDFKSWTPVYITNAPSALFRFRLAPVKSSEMIRVVGY